MGEETTAFLIQRLDKKAPKLYNYSLIERTMMTYLEEFRSSLTARDYNKILVLWQEYCENDQLDVSELSNILQLIKKSDFATSFGKYVEAILPLVMTVSDEKEQLELLQHLYDLQTTNSQTLYDLAREILTRHFGKDPKFNEKLRIIGLRTKDSFQGVVSNFLLLNHIEKGNFVLHASDWGVGEIVDCSFLREQIIIEFENVHGTKKAISFKNGFRSLIPLPKDHFFVLRFADPDQLEEKATKQPVELISHLLRDLGPKTANEIKDLLYEYVIDADRYSKWWQATRAKLKKDGHIQLPKTAKDKFLLREEKIEAVDRLHHALEGKEGFYEIFGTIYPLIRDFPELLKKKSKSVEIVREKALSLLEMEGISDIDRLQAYFFLQYFLEDTSYSDQIRAVIQNVEDVQRALCQIDVVVMRKYFMQAIRQICSDWEELFCQMLLVAEPSQLRDYLLKELSIPETTPRLLKLLEYLLEHPASYPEPFLWYFQKLVSHEARFMTSQHDRERFFESFLLLLSSLEHRPAYRDIVKKIHALLTGERFRIVRELLKDSDKAFAQEFLLLASKCHTIAKHNQKILRSLVDVVHGAPEAQAKPILDQSIIWTTGEGYEKVKERIAHLGTVEIVDNAKEIEAARALGDLRENSEFKFALERRSRLQKELKTLSDQFHKARIITPDDISLDVVGIGNRIELEDEKGKKQTFSILGPWDADPDKQILSLHSKLAQTLVGKQVGDSFVFRDEKVTVKKIASCIGN